jgi:glycosyltransferase involved in cell wall biosynthesis
VDPHRIAVVVKGYPRLSETFIAQEILGLERRGLDLVIISLRHPTDGAIHPVHRAIRAPVRYLPEYLKDDPARVWRAWRALRGSDRYRSARRLWHDDLRRDPTTNRGRRFGQALVLAHELEPEVGLIYAHYLHTPASVARYAAALSGRPLCISAHAKDIWISPDWEKREKILASRWVTTCTGSGATHLRALAPNGRILLNHHGLDLARFPPPPRPRDRNGDEPADPVVLLGVARLVAKKGIDTLLRALSLLPAELNWRYEHVGGGALARQLRDLAGSLGIADRVHWHGALPEADVVDAYRRADIVVLASRIAPDGDRDGLPNVLLEAAGQAVACVSTRTGAIGELIADGRNGLLVQSDDPPALAAALTRLIQDPARRGNLGEAARRTVAAHFSPEPGLDRLAHELELALGVNAARAA